MLFRDTESKMFGTKQRHESYRCLLFVVHWSVRLEHHSLWSRPQLHAWVIPKHELWSFHVQNCLTFAFCCSSIEDTSCTITYKINTLHIPFFLKGPFSLLQEKFHLNICHLFLWSETSTHDILLCPEPEDLPMPFTCCWSAWPLWAPYAATYYR